jgi:hypothetical protein
MLGASKAALVGTHPLSIYPNENSEGDQTASQHIHSHSYKDKRLSVREVLKEGEEIEPGEFGSFDDDMMMIFRVVRNLQNDSIGRSARSAFLLGCGNIPPSAAFFSSAVTPRRCGNIVNGEKPGSQSWAFSPTQFKLFGRYFEATRSLVSTAARVSA